MQSLEFVDYLEHEFKHANGASMPLCANTAQFEIYLLSILPSTMHKWDAVGNIPLLTFQGSLHGSVVNKANKLKNVGCSLKAAISSKSDNS